MIYLDYAATTPLSLAALAAMQPYFSNMFANPASLHSGGRAANAALEKARTTLACCVNAESPSTITITGGGTDGSNLVIAGLAQRWEADTDPSDCHILVSAIEHEAVLNPALALHKRGWQLTVLPVTPTGHVSVDALERALQQSLHQPNAQKTLVSIMHANNEVGSLQPIQALASLAHQYGAVFHTDAVQTVGKIPVDVQQLGVDYLTWSAHKHYGPKGVGALYTAGGALTPAPLLLGGGQENGLRSGTVNVAGAVGVATALEECVAAQPKSFARLEMLTQHLRDGLESLLCPCPLVINTPADDSIPGIVHVSVLGNSFPIQGESLLLQLDLLGIAASSGSACHAVALEPSRILHAMMVGENSDRALTSEELARATGTIRFSMGHHTTQQDVDALLAAFPKALNRLMKTAPTMSGVH
ncbi:MAG: cysteine desulfurase family protein [Vampirovibrionales bacterium]|nr:cysteine desulfurase family protein [Vampirovibrionales bacterium]